MHCWRGPRGILIEVIQLDQKQRIKITQTVNGSRYLVGYFGTPADIVKYVDLADLVEIFDFPAGDA